MFRALLCSSSPQILLYSIWYRNTEKSEWYKITKTQFYKYEHVVVLECNYCILKDTIWPPDDEHNIARNMYRNIINLL